MIRAQNLYHSYNHDMALDNINLQINKGDFIAITGESGSGKSTLLSILSTLLKPSKGELFFEQTNYKDITNIDTFRQQNIGFIFQFHYLINYLTLQENIQIANEQATSKEIEALFERLDIQNIQKRFPNEVSGGQKQRAAIARALINQPKVIFADEPTGNLDSHNSLNVFNLFKELSDKGTTIVVATHDLKLAQLANNVYEVKDGQLQ
ncbi:ABC transporter ATP-binding protein [Candidatus Marinarcus aquaticus]|uniref:Peptide ABC transporter ATP-binding protein n=1 Tax=Candidatus Marinarcus aquaticus TaxID=2044504 RepID=A0A4V1LP36_9BACT|nr:ABC transporter ATP-binding protein [Candidatus Marinarcus aquaticus]RXJ58150.1 peptide ABC transporter ATP-binding protein [Candidatus Marinarcus aquaticus]